MHKVKGIWVLLRTAQTTQGISGPGTDDHVYVGIIGRHGGSEFPLDVRDFDDFEAGTSVKYWFGDVWEGTALTDAKRPYEADGENHPYRRNIDLEGVDYVYIRKHSTRGSDKDDSWRLEAAALQLYADTSPVKRSFVKPEPIWLGNEYGHTVYLWEISYGDRVAAADPLTAMMQP